jgi:hypothetical protein
VKRCVRCLQHFVRHRPGLLPHPLLFGDAQRDVANVRVFVVERVEYGRRHPRLGHVVQSDERLKPELRHICGQRLLDRSAGRIVVVARHLPERDQRHLTHARVLVLGGLDEHGAALARPCVG